MPVKPRGIGHHVIVSAPTQTINVSEVPLFHLRSTYGYELKEKDEYMPVIKKAVDALVTSQGIGFMVDKLPICKTLLLPGVIAFLPLFPQ